MLVACSRPDLWAIGACLYFYIFGTYPFAGATDYLIMERIKRLDYAVHEDCDPDASDLIKRLLVRRLLSATAPISWTYPEVGS